MTTDHEVLTKDDFNRFIISTHQQFIVASILRCKSTVSLREVYANQ